MLRKEQNYLHCTCSTAGRDRETNKGKAAEEYIGLSLQYWLGASRSTSHSAIAGSNAAMMPTN
jgi:hypothetical protein